MCCTHKECSLNLDLMISGNYVVNMIMLMSIYVYMYVCMSCMTGLSWIMIVYANVYIYIYVYVSMSLSDSVTRDHSCREMISCVGEWHEEVLGYEESSGKSSHDKYMRLVSCGYELILYSFIMLMFMLCTCYTEGCISEMKEVWYVAC